MGKEYAHGASDAQEIVAHAMWIALWKQLEYPLREVEATNGQIQFGKRGMTGRDEIFWTQNKCAAASSYALCEIARQHQASAIFDRYFLVSSWGVSMFGPEYVRHAYFFVRDGRHDMWYMGSPANYTMTREPDALRFVAGSLPYVVGQCKEFDLGSACIWPDEKRLQSIVTQYPGVIPVFTSDNGSSFGGVMRVFEIQSHKEGVAAGITDVKIDFRQTAVDWE